MPLQTDIFTKIEERFVSLISESEHLLEQMRQEDNAKRERARANRIGIAGELHVATESFYSLQTKFLSLINLLSTTSQHLTGIYSEVKGLEDKIRSAEKLRGLISGLHDDFNSGMLDSILNMIETNIATDYLGQAELLLKEGQSGKYNHVPAAVLTGAILENALRKLCQRQNPPIPLDKPNGQPKTLNSYISDLQNANVYNAAKAKQLTAWAATRNHAAHGEFDDFTRGDVEQMLLGVQNFLADYL